MTRWQSHPLRELREAEWMFGPRRYRLRSWVKIALLLAATLAFWALVWAAMLRGLDRMPGRGALSPAATAEMKGDAR